MKYGLIWSYMKYISCKMLCIILLSVAQQIYSQSNVSQLYSQEQYNDNNNQMSRLAAEQTRFISLLFSFIQCFPNSSNNNLDVTSKYLIKINQNFNPESHLDEYSNLTEIQNLMALVKMLEASRTPKDLPFTNAPDNLSQLSLIFKVLYHNSENWPLFLKTSAWLLQRVNMAQLFWALSIVSSEKFTDTVTVPSAVEIFPQLFLPKKLLLGAVDIPKIKDNNNTQQQQDSSYYWVTDPGIHEFHTHWHMDNPFWWDDKIYGVKRHRKGELFWYMHHNILNRYNVELLSIGLPEVEPLGLDPDYQIPEGYTTDILNIDYTDFPSRPDGDKIGNWDNGVILAQLRDYFNRLSQGIQQGYFLGLNENHVSIQEENGTDIVGATAESSRTESVNFGFYGQLHNYMHRLLAGMMKPQEFPVPGVQSHSETAMRDRVFYQIHSKVDKLFWGYKKTLPPYKQDDLEFPGVSILTVNIVTNTQGNQYSTPSHDLNGQFKNNRYADPVTLTTYLKTRSYDVSTAARPCRSVNDDPITVEIQTLDYVPFTYVITIQSVRTEMAYGMVRIFMWQKYFQDGKLLDNDEAHERAIEMDRFRIKIEPGKVAVITRSSLDSSLTRLEPSPGIKTLYNVKPSSPLLLNREIMRACAFPNNLLVPTGTKEGTPFKLTVYLSDETDAREVEDNQFPHYPFCGALNGLPFPDKRPMGFPFDRPGTRFNITPISEEYSPVFNSNSMVTNVNQINVVVKHQN